MAAGTGVGGQAEGVASPPGPLILRADEAERQHALLVQLKAALDGFGVQAVVARNHHVGLPTEHARVSGACGLKSPILFVCTADDGVIRVQVSERSYVLATGESFPGDAEAAARGIAGLVGTVRASRSLPPSRDARGSARRHA
jgi:hypothetical protein